jgi:addiction module RelE/StbE family toxin
MAYNLKITKSAKKDISRIIYYIINELKSPITAEKLINNIDKKYDNLIENPKIYEKCNNERLCKKGYRKVLIGKYLLIYKIEKDSVIVLRFFHGFQDYIKYL